MSRIGIGLPVFQSLAPAVAFDYMRMFYSFGRRYPKHDFFLLTRTKSEQFRARNAIVETALQFGMDYLLFLDDDHVINWQGTQESTPYNFLQQLIDHKKPIVGCLYYHRSGDYRPVLMKEVGPHQYAFLADNEITGGLQQVDVQGGGCMLIDMKIFDKIKPPYFEPEQQTEGKNLGTDIQLCRKAKAAGFSVWCDTSIVVGHLRNDPEIVTSDNRDSFIAENALKGRVLDDWIVDNWLVEYRKDVEEYTGFEPQEIIDRAYQYNDVYRVKFSQYDDPKDYYRSLGIEQLCRQYFYHCKKEIAYDGLVILKNFRRGVSAQGIDFGCGSAPVGYELLKMGHRMDFVDIEGTPAYEFLKWRVEKSKYKDRVGWSVYGPYDFALFLDTIEHLPNWEEELDNIIGRLKPKAALVTNYFSNTDNQNPEHVSMDKKAVLEFLLSRNMVPRSWSIWLKDDNYMGGAMSNKTEKRRKVA